MFRFIFILSSLLLLASAASISKRSVKKEVRVYGGDPAEPNEYPFAAVLLILTDDDDDFICGGVLISNRNILTTAQCVFKSEFIIASIGVHYYLDDEDRTDTLYNFNDLQTYLTVHEDFNPVTRVHNIALLRLKEPVEFNEKIQSIQLAPTSFTPNAIRETDAVIIGWGVSEDALIEITYPRHANVTILPPALCGHYYSAQNTSLVFCSDGEFKKGACAFDEGGPVIQTIEEGGQLLIGIISLYGQFGCDSGWPTAFVSVAAYLPWINERTQSLSEN